MHSKLTVIMLFYFKQESDPDKATFAKVIPTPNNGSAELVPLLRDKVRAFFSWCLGVTFVILKINPPGNKRNHFNEMNVVDFVIFLYNFQLIWYKLKIEQIHCRERILCHLMEKIKKII